MEKYYKPAKELQNYIRFYLDIELEEGQFINNPNVNYPTIYPAVNIVYSEMTNDYRVGNNVYHGLRFFMGGLTRLSSQLLTHYEMSLITVFFTPAGFQHIFNTSIANMLDRFTPMEEIDPADDTPLLINKLIKEDKPEKRIELIETYFLEHLKNSDYKTGYTDLVVNLILEKQANIKVNEISVILDIPERTLRRNFQREMGVTVKEFINIARINFASVLLTVNPDLPANRLIHKLGYYDQSHFLKHLRKYVGVSTRDFKELSKTFLASYSKIETEDHF
jgi:AraC-like DNA-binding protein